MERKTVYPSGGVFERTPGLWEVWNWRKFRRDSRINWVRRAEDCWDVREVVGRIVEVVGI